VLAALAGGVGAARLLAGLVSVIPPEEITAVVNTGDDAVVHGLHVSPDLDTVTYTLAGAVNPATGWGLSGDTFSAMEALESFGSETWFRLGDRDLATHLYRTERLEDGASLSEVTAEVASTFGVPLRLLPMSDHPVRTRLRLGTGEEVAFQEYFVKLRHDVAVRSVRFEGANVAEAAPGVLEAIEAADVVVVCPSNPIVSIGPLLAVPGIEEALAGRRDDALAVSPIVAGAALKGPADRLMSELGHEPSVVGVARLYAPYVSTLVVDRADEELAGRVEEEGVRCQVTETVMASPEVTRSLATVVSAGGRAA
jgi:LPPG:FO 2-phospho-L-lactate transferase